LASRSFLGLPTPNDHLALAPERAVGGEALAVAAVRLHRQEQDRLPAKEGAREEFL